MSVRDKKNTSPRVLVCVFVVLLVCFFGDVAVGADSSKWPMAVLRGDVNRLRVGARTSVQDGTGIHVTHPYPARPGGNAVQIGDEVTIGHRVVLLGCSFGNRCLIGIGVVFFVGVVLFVFVLLGAGSLVTEGKELAGGYLYLGSPARQVRRLSEEEIAYFGYAAAHYVKLKEEYKIGG